ncbi:uncharacterized protein [Choristoneura fumiferana]|uniref:uncharacterized protein n=1 Tax=Choristoneura fumiferana TaxID=7141 RepID=UPI003D1582D6
MAMLRSPTASQSSSNPDLSTSHEDPAISFVNTRKRKQPKEDELITKMLDLYTKKIQASLNDFKTGVDSSIAEIRKDINDDIKLNLSNLSTITSDIKSEVNSMRSEYKDVQNKLTVMNSKQEEFAATISEMCAGMDFSSDRQDKFDKRLKNIEECIKSHNQCEPELLQLKKNSSNLQFQLNEYQQRERILNLEITGLPELKTENLTDIMIAIANYSGVILTSADIEHVNRVQPRQAVAGRPRAVVMKLKKRILKDNILAGIRKARGITTQNINIPGGPTTYLCE